MPRSLLAEGRTAVPKKKRPTPSQMRGLRPFTPETAREAASKPRLKGGPTVPKYARLYQYQVEWLEGQGKNISDALRKVIDRAMQAEADE